MAERRQLFAEMRAQDLDRIRLSTYRTACKLRFVQKKCNLHLVDIWNVIEALRENALNNLDPNIELSVARLEAVISTIFYQLNKRMPTTHQIQVEQSVSLLLNFLLAALDPEGHGKSSVFAVKMALATLCGGKIMDKLRYIFSMISDSSGVMVYGRYDQFLQEVLKLPTAVFEGPSFGYTEQSARSCFSQQKKVTLNGFLDTLMSDPPPTVSGLAAPPAPAGKCRKCLPSRRVFLLPQREHDGLPLPMPAVPRLPALPGLLLEGARQRLPQQPAPDEGVHIVEITC